MKRILANDGIDAAGKAMLEKAGFFVETTKAADNHLAETINNENFDVLLVRSATKVTANLMQACPRLKLVGRAGVGLDNIDLTYAAANDIKVVNTPAASSQSVAELVFAHLFSGARFLQDANFRMRTEGDTKFAALKKAYSAGIELQGKTIGIVGFGRIGQAVGSMALGLGMTVVASDPYIQEATLHVHIPQAKADIPVNIKTEPLEMVIRKADFITLHVPGKINGKAVIGATEIKHMQTGTVLINASRGGVIDEDALLVALDQGKIRFAGLDVFENEPTPRTELLTHPAISLSPHIGASTNEAQERIGLEMANAIIGFFKED
ncbi:MAG: D-2-hydroxyacid dehydrogenase [Bacteroidia bacterium]|jgi:D-3-phosphoglycerate dehydrogenase|nr:D-2-hydroxyacid dehydrogenase [Bacteroidia bacterium]MCC6767583.1 D-2-hydroxyacid dehydrogenase [Bacteroidia bacterium]